MPATERPPDLTPPFGGLATFFRAPHRVDPSDLDVALFGVPYDLAVTHRAGARHGPRSVRAESMRIIPDHYIAKIRPFDRVRAADLGDAPLPDWFDIAKTHDDIRSFAAEAVRAGALPIAVGGDHSISFPLLLAVGAAEPVGLIHFDAHCDTELETNNCRFAHGSPFRLAVENGVLDPARTIQIGIRGHTECLWDFSYEKGMRVIHIEEFETLGRRGVLAEIARVAGAGPVYLSFDVDAIDPAFAPGTGTPEPGGLTSREALGLLRGLFDLNLDLVGADLVEIAPPMDASGQTSWLGATILFDLFCLAALAKTRPRP